MKIKGWKKFQHFKDRKPPWIKLYRDLLDDPDWHDLSGDDAKSLVMLWMIASEHEGFLPDSRKLAFRLRIKESEVNQMLNNLSHWLDRDDTNAISDKYRGDAPETETETEKRQNTSDKKSDDLGFEEFYKKYPRHEGRGQAEKAYRAAIKTVARDEMLAGLDRAIANWSGVDKKFIPLPATWLNGKRWLDELDARPTAKSYSIETDPAYRGVQY